MTPPAIPVTTNAIINCVVPIQAPMAAHQFHIPHPHAAHPAKTAEEQRRPTPDRQRLCPTPLQPWSHAGDHDAREQEREHQPVGDAAAAQIREGRDGENSQVGHQAIECITCSFPT